MKKQFVDLEVVLDEACCLNGIIRRLPGDKIVPLAVAVAYLSEGEEHTVVGYLKMLEFIIENELVLVEEETYVRSMVTEDAAAAGAAATVSAGSVNPVGGGVTNSVTGVQPIDEPVIEPATKKNKKKMDTVAAYGRLFNR